MLEAEIYSLPMNSGQTRKAVKAAHTQCHADPSLYLFPVKITISKASEHTRCPGSAQQQEQKEGKDTQLFIRWMKKTPNQFEIWSAHGGQVLKQHY